MTDPRRPEVVEVILRLESNSFIRYCVESGEAKSRDAFDRKVDAVFQDWYRATEQNCRALRDLLADIDYVPGEGSWPLSFAQFNFLTPAYLLDHVERFMAPLLDLIRDKAALLEGWPEARDLVTALLEREQPFLERVRELRTERPKPEPGAPVVRGTSASRW